jgi:RNA polymerase sigma-70 factor (ECF subfamily)
MADDPAFDDFYRASSRRMLKYAYGMVGDAGNAQDIVQEAYIRAWRHWSTINRYEHPETWVRLVVSRLATDWWRRLAVRRRFALAERGPDPVPAPSETTVMLVSALRQLPPRQRQAFCLHHVLDLSVGDIARELGVAEGTVKSWLFRARASLAQTLSPLSPSTRPEGTDVR